MFQVHGTGDEEPARGVYDEPVVAGAERPRRNIARAVQQMCAELVWRLERWGPLPGNVQFALQFYLYEYSLNLFTPSLFIRTYFYLPVVVLFHFISYLAN